ncbi:MAG: zinc-binding protein [Chloroflexaceae bacterium]|nr:zinc-binding protein [Chloroflexaceae bacterium]
MSFADVTLVCRDCGKEFVFTAGEQEFFSQKGFLHDPVRCPACRRARKQAPDRGRQERRDHDNPTSPPPHQRGGFPAVCSACGKPTTVPFAPRDDRPVYCDACFQAIRQSRGDHPPAPAGSRHTRYR